MCSQTVGMLGAQAVASTYIHFQKNKIPQKKKLVSDLEQKMCKMTLKHFFILEIQRSSQKLLGLCQKNSGANTKGLTLWKTVESPKTEHLRTIWPNISTYRCAFPKSCTREERSKNVYLQNAKSLQAIQMSIDGKVNKLWNTQTDYRAFKTNEPQ